MNHLNLVEPTFSDPRRDVVSGDMALATAFLQASRTSTTDLLAVNERVLLATTGSAARVSGIDQSALWQWARMRPRGPAVLQVDAQPPLRATCVPVVDDRELVGMLLELDAVAPPRLVTHAEHTELFRSVVPGSSHVATALRAELGHAFEAGGDLLIKGEAGTGKSTIGRHLLGLDSDGEPIHELDLANVAEEELVEALRRALQHTRLLLTHLDEVPSELRSDVLVLLARPRPGCKVVATVGGTGLGSEGDAVFTRRVDLTPLRERLEDLPAIAAQLLSHRGGRCPKRLDPSVRRQLWSYHWPGNVTELERVLLDAAALAPTSVIDESCIRLPAGPGGGLAARRRSLVEAAEMDSLLDALQRCGGNKVAAADMLGISRSTLYRKARALGV